MSDQEKNFTEKVKAWYASKEGKESLRKAIETAVAENKKLKMRRQISPEVLRKPFTI